MSFKYNGKTHLPMYSIWIIKLTLWQIQHEPVYVLFDRFYVKQQQTRLPAWHIVCFTVILFVKHMWCA